MNVAVPREIVAGEQRVALVPESVKRLKKADDIEILVEAGAGERASFSDQEYTEAGARVVPDAGTLWAEADLVVKIQRPLVEQGNDEAAGLRAGAGLVCMLQPALNTELVKRLADGKITAFSLDALPRITRAQAMDVLSSMSTVAGYKSVLLAAAAQGKFFPMLVTAAGTIPPLKVLILGAGVAGLQAIATARRLGAVVEAFDVRPAAKEQVESLGARFLTAEAVEAEGAGGYARELSEEQHKRELELIHEHIKHADTVITTALIPGRPAPLLITEPMVNDMHAGSVIVDLAAEMGGNCELTEKDRDVVRDGVTIMGPVNLPATMPVHASQMFSRNVTAFLNLLIKDGGLNLDFDDEIIRDTCITHDGNVLHQPTKQAIEGGSEG